MAQQEREWYRAIDGWMPASCKFRSSLIVAGRRVWISYQEVDMRVPASASVYPQWSAGQPPQCHSLRTVDTTAQQEPLLVWHHIVWTVVTSVRKNVRTRSSSQILPWSLSRCSSKCGNLDVSTLCASAITFPWRRRHGSWNATIIHIASGLWNVTSSQTLWDLPAAFPSILWFSMVAVAGTVEMCFYFVAQGRRGFWIGREAVLHCRMELTH
jgi:hypothetical protein